MRGSEGLAAVRFSISKCALTASTLLVPMRMSSRAFFDSLVCSFHSASATRLRWAKMSCSSCAIASASAARRLACSSGGPISRIIALGALAIGFRPRSLQNVFTLASRSIMTSGNWRLKSLN